MLLTLKIEHLSRLLKRSQFCIAHKNELFFLTKLFLLKKNTDNCFHRGHAYYNTEVFVETSKTCINKCECVAHSRGSYVKCEPTR